MAKPNVRTKQRSLLWQTLLFSAASDRRRLSGRAKPNKSWDTSGCELLNTSFERRGDSSFINLFGAAKVVPGRRVLKQPESLCSKAIARLTKETKWLRRWLWVR